MVNVVGGAIVPLLAQQRRPPQETEVWQVFALLETLEWLELLSVVLPIALGLVIAGYALWHARKGKGK